MVISSRLVLVSSLLALMIHSTYSRLWLNARELKKDAAALLLSNINLSG